MMKRNTNKLLLGRHGGPTTLALILHGTLGNAVTKVGSNDGASSLHVEEVGSQGTLGSIGVVLTLLALLLLLNGGQGDARDLGHGLEVEHVAQLGNADISAILEKGGLSNQQVGLTEIVGTEGPDEVLNGSQTLVDLW
jgi:hypothetical protein